MNRLHQGTRVIFPAQERNEILDRQTIIYTGDQDISTTTRIPDRPVVFVQLMLGFRG